MCQLWLRDKSASTRSLLPMRSGEDLFNATEGDLGSCGRSGLLSAAGPNNTSHHINCGGYQSIHYLFSFTVIVHAIIITYCSHEYFSDGKPRH